MLIAICIPARDLVHAGFAKSLANLTSYLSKININYELLINLGTVLPQQRNTLVESALKIKADYILWLDSDMHFPNYLVEKFLEHRKDIVATTYSTRIKPQRSVAFLDKNNLDLRLKKNNGLHKVWAVGMGCMLISTKIFQYISKPYFQYIWNEDTQDLSGEDIYFCNLLNESGFEIFVDCDLSKDIAHYGTKAYLIGETNENN